MTRREIAEIEEILAEIHRAQKGYKDIALCLTDTRDQLQELKDKAKKESEKRSYSVPWYLSMI